jgi:hypothetical protein
MTRTLFSLRLFEVAFSIFAVTNIASGQDNTGTPPFNSFGGGPDIVNLSNLNANLEVPVIQRNGRGIPFHLTLSFNTYVWYKFHSGTQTSWAPTSSLGRPTSSTPFGSVTRSVVTSNTCLNRYPIATYSNWVYVDASGTPHLFSITTQASTQCGTTTDTGTSSDGSGYTLKATGGTPNWVSTPDGTVISNLYGSPTLMQDRNGNQISA